uniref:hypothetical protein n=1 Tax=Burkholderia diffusa TaxID=488732 RepID=UPI001CC352C9|nr:hypothetical protein [Burkholderia diffusa]
MVKTLAQRVAMTDGLQPITHRVSMRCGVTAAIYVDRERRQRASAARIDAIVSTFGGNCMRRAYAGGSESRRASWRDFSDDEGAWKRIRLDG